MERKKRERKREKESFEILYTGYLLSIVKVKTERERDQNIIIKEKNNKCNKKAADGTKKWEIR